MNSNENVLINKKKKLHPEEEDTKLLFDVFLQLMGLQKLLIDKGIISKDELKNAVNKETASMLKPFLEKAGVSEDQIIEVLNTSIKNRGGNFDNNNK